jgi:hypothetical protein
VVDPYPQAEGRLYRLFTPQGTTPEPTGPVILSSPGAVTVLVGGTARLTVLAHSPGSIDYQWFFEGTPLMGQTADTLLLSNVQTNDDGAYSVVVTDYRGSEPSAPVPLKVLVFPVIQEHPQSQEVPVGQAVVFSVVATGNSPLSFIWRKDGRRLTGQIDSMLVLPAVQPSDAGSYSVIVRHPTKHGPIGTTSRSAVLKVIGP